jgi:tight adherence protein B
VGLAALGIALVSAASAFALALGLIGATIAWLVWRKQRETQALAATREVARACRVLDVLLSQGHVPTRALIQASLECPVLDPAAATAQMGGDTAAVLRRSGERPGAAGLVEVARAWEMTARTGAPLHGVLSRVTANLEAQASLAATIAQELAASRASSQILAVLPFGGFGLAAFAGGHPVAFLSSTLPGRICLIAGVGLACAGALWSDALATRAARLTPLQPSAGRRRPRPLAAQKRRTDLAGRPPSAPPSASQPAQADRLAHTSSAPPSDEPKPAAGRSGWRRTGPARFAEEGPS